METSKENSMQEQLPTADDIYVAPDQTTLPNEEKES